MVFWVGVVKIGHGYLFSLRPSNLLYLKNVYVNWADFLHADCDAVIFGKTNIALFIFDF